MSGISRRQFAASIASGTIAAGMPLQGIAATRAPSPNPLTLPSGFLWGCATSAYQIEGGVAEDGRAPSIWDTFAHTAGKTFNGQTGDVADDSYHRYQEDVKLLRDLGAKAYRFSISWSRVIPNGTGQTNPKGIAYYDRLVDELLKSGIQPFVTLFHWDLPAALSGAWQSRDTAKAFADYAGVMAKHLSDRVRHFITTNEIVCFTDLSYRVGQFAPGLKLGATQVNQVRHHGALAHGLGVQAIRANSPSATQVGIAENPRVFVPVIETPAHIEAARRAYREENAPFLTAVMEGKYTDAYLAREGASAPKVASGDMAIIGSPIDFVGLNVYQPDYVRASESPLGYTIEARPGSFPHMPSPWLYVGPEVMYWAIRLTSELWKPTAIYITENGCSAEDLKQPGLGVQDTDRVMYLRNHLTHLSRAAQEGFSVKGYFLWSLLDNFEWADGFEKRFGIYHVDFDTQNRTPKLSAEWYREVIRANAVL
jgi:beta-glucosidase